MGEPRGWTRQQKAAIWCHCPRPGPLLRSAQVPRGTSPLSNRRWRLSPAQWGPQVCVPGRRRRAATLAHQPLLPPPATQPSPTASPTPMWILATSCQYREAFVGVRKGTFAAPRLPGWTSAPTVHHSPVPTVWVALACPAPSYPPCPYPQASAWKGLAQG